MFKNFTAFWNSKKKTEEVRIETERFLHEREVSIQKREALLIEREEYLLQRERKLETEKKELFEKEKKITHTEDEIQKREVEIIHAYENLAGISRSDARMVLFQDVEKEAEHDLFVRMKKLEHTSRDILERRASQLLITTLERMPHTQVASSTSTQVEFTEDLKGKIIGKEGRNIRTFERLTGVELIIDESPDSVIVSCFDPVRREIGRILLERIRDDDRIQPARIEELYGEVKKTIHESIRQKGEDAIREVGIMSLDGRVVTLLGQLHFRTSYGQNVLRHSIEMAHFAGMLASELGAHVEIAKAGALVHDIGKALDYEFKGSHVVIGMRVLEKFGTRKEIIDAMKSHHGEFPEESIEAAIVTLADHVSGARPGARRDSLENYTKRLQDLERVVMSLSGVEKTYALSAGREIRVFVTPESISDYQAQKMAREIALKIEDELVYPGEIRVTVIRESRVIDFAR